VEKETGKTLFNLGSCGLDIQHDDFRNECNAAKWNIEDSLSCLRWLLRIPLPGEKTLQKLQGVHNCTLGFLGNVSIAERAPSILPNLKMYVDAIKAIKNNYQSQQKNNLKSLNAYFRVSALHQD
jgi:hypothetical protein